MKFQLLQSHLSCLDRVHPAELQSGFPRSGPDVLHSPHRAANTAQHWAEIRLNRMFSFQRPLALTCF